MGDKTSEACEAVTDLCSHMLGDRAQKCGMCGKPIRRSVMAFVVMCPCGAVGKQTLAGVGPDDPMDAVNYAWSKP